MVGWNKTKEKLQARQKSFTQFLFIHSFWFNSSLHMLHWFTPLGGNKATSTDVQQQQWLTPLNMDSTAKIVLLRNTVFFYIFTIHWISNSGIDPVKIHLLCRKTRLEPLWDVICINCWCQRHLTSPHFTSPYLRESLSNKLPWQFVESKKNVNLLVWALLYES